jgi:CDP-diacylglycerol--serine O-phosphatidyltransferase
MRRRQMLYVLPNLFTFSSVFCGVLAIHWATAPGDATNFYRAALAILFAAVFDMMDGRVARLTRTESEIGVQLDSLADVISFGVAPAVLVYRWGLGEISVAGVDVGFLVSFSFVAAGAFRLARFNVLAARAERLKERGRPVPETSRAWFVGLPIPAAAAVIAGLVFAHHQTEAPLFQKRLLLLIIVPLLAWLMVSSVRFRTFKRVQFTRRTLLALLATVGLAGLVTIGSAPAVALLALIMVYIGIGLTEYLIGAPRRLADRRSARAARRAAALAATGAAVDAGAAAAPPPGASPGASGDEPV